MNDFTRRGFLATSSLTAASLALPVYAYQPGLPAPQPTPQPNKGGPQEGDGHRGPCSISSANGLKTVSRAMELLIAGYDPADACVQGVRIVEDDPDDVTVGLGGEPNEDGIVELDASVMHGPTHKSGAVAGLRNIKNPAMVALLVCRRTDHCLIVGEGALRFAKQYGFKEEDLLTERSRLEWQKWRENMSKQDDRLNDDERDAPVGKEWHDGDAAAQQKRASILASPVHTNTGTIHCSSVTQAGDVASCTTTSGLSWKIPGRIGDSPIIGAGNYCDNAIGAGGCTGRGEAAIVNLAAFNIVAAMGRGLSPTEACLEVAKRVADHTKEKRLLGADGRPIFDIKFYALRKDGAHGAASLRPGAEYAVHDSKGARLVPAPSLFSEKLPGT
jgi:N4-(beta-N-acetylglucosaminyl)-L-asparaginase